MEDSCSWSTDSPSQSTSPSLLTGSIVSTAAGGGGGETMATIQTVNLSTKLVKDSTSSLKGVLGSEVKSGPTLQQQVPKEPPTLPSNLPTTVLSKILALEQV